ncbi:iron chaperone [Asanoa siamensis]|uniref:iron chaperone n=1 Tax=Asanoa siamensis TaxID=926357 RepID=UPI001941B224|nr:DUF1801 domain-containing protein [Asanoa siamensis]
MQLSAPFPQPLDARFAGNVRAMGSKPKTIDEYLSDVDPARRAELERIRALVKKLVPEAEEAIYYGMPALKYKKRALVYFTASKKHMSFMPSSWAIEEHTDKLAGYETTEHSIKFTLDNPLPDTLIETLVRNHRRDIDADRH